MALWTKLRFERNKKNTTEGKNTPKEYCIRGVGGGGREMEGVTGIGRRMIRNKWISAIENKLGGNWDKKKTVEIIY